ncbi:hypothetical protein K9N68_03405 [Kovacikia minuta CCNUW1]|uniref:hypothetical protein n=1 Tax=Kovacikia minuta TaxID=2931930 RepID=UPI001CC9EE29|nr:hypothetical protein [Kovacikia minuta]UBF27040.1 hypothetical protein K9N68_03405 [Kovacikia minuta CCNUW1]
MADTLASVSLHEISLFNQPSILLDPVISDLDNAVPVKSLRTLVSTFIRVQPSREQTYCLINRSKLFALTSLISFNSTLAEDTIATLKELLGLHVPNFQAIPVGIHLAALGFRSGNPAITAAVLQAIEKVKSRQPFSSPTQ